MPHETLTVPKSINIKNDNRVFIVGMTGSGKTFLARKLLIGRGPLIVVDPKHTFSWKAGPKYDDVYWSFNQLKKWDFTGSAIYRPTEDEIDDFLSEFWRWVWTHTPVLVYVDEVTDITPPVIPPKGLRRAIKMGRERKLSVWYSSQRPALIPTALMSESEVIFSGMLKNEDDRKRIAKYTGNPELIQPMPPYRFMYCNSFDHNSFDFDPKDIVRRKREAE